MKPYINWEKIILKIDIQNSLNEKKNKELVSSMKRLIAFTFYNFEHNILSDKENKKLIIEFNNGDTFTISSTLLNGKYINSYSYQDNCDNNLKTIPLQAALNINKYSGDIEARLKNKDDIMIEACYTEQSLDKFPIFKLNDAGLEQKLKNIVIDIETENIER